MGINIWIQCTLRDISQSDPIPIPPAHPITVRSHSHTTSPSHHTISHHTMLLPLLLLSLSPTIVSRSLRGPHLTISVFPGSKPHLMMKEGHENIIGNAKYEGLLVDLLTELSITLGFTYTLEPVSDGHYGTRNEIGSWSGMIGEVISGAADMTITMMRETVVDFVPYMSLGLSILYSRHGQGRIHSLDQLSRSHSVKLGTFNGGSTSNYFRHSPLAVNQRIWNKMVADDSMVTSNQEGVNRVLEEEGGFAHIMESVSVDYFMARNCDLIKVGDVFSPRTYGLAIPQGSPHREELTLAILRMQESGRMEQIVDSWVQRRGEECGQPEISLIGTLMGMF